VPCLAALLPVRGAERTDCSTVSPYNHENDRDLLLVPVYCLRGELYVFPFLVYVEWFCRYHLCTRVK
jgi:hypothetical protein